MLLLVYVEVVQFLSAMLVTSCEPRPLAKGESILLSVGRSWPTSATSTGKSAFLYPTSFGSRLRWEYKRFEAKHPLPKNH